VVSDVQPGAQTIKDFSPLSMVAMAFSHPSITIPAPNTNEKGVPRFLELRFKTVV